MRSAGESRSLILAACAISIAQLPLSAWATMDPAATGAAASAVIGAERSRPVRIAPGRLRTGERGLSDKLTRIRSQVISAEQSLIESLKEQKQVRRSLRKIQSLIKLQKQERELGKQRMSELEGTIAELESRRDVLKRKIQLQQRRIRVALIEIDRSVKEQPKTPHLPERERIEAPRRRVLANLAGRGLKEIEAFRIDLADADQLETRIQEEKHELAYLFQDLDEKSGILELNQQIQVDVLKRRNAERIAQLESYRKLKGAEAQVERLITDFNSRIELEHAVETERVVSKAMTQGDFSRMKGILPLPAEGKVVSFFGRSFDNKSSLYIFKKGIDIDSGKRQPVRAVSAGKVAYSGELPSYGRVTIIDHGEHYYTLCAHLGELHKQAGEAVRPGDPIGLSDDQGTPVYFEIRARNIAVNPLQWISN